MKPESLAPATLAALVPINILSREQQQVLLRSAQLIELAAGQVLALQSSPPRALFLLSGAIHAHSARGTRIEHLRAGSAAAAARLDTRSPPAQSLQASEVSQLLSVDAGLLDVLLSCEASETLIVAEAGDIVASGDAADDWMLHLLQLPFIQRVPPAQLQTLFQRLQRIDADRGQVLIRQNDPGEHFFILLSGACLVTREQPGAAALAIAELKPGACFGEEALIADGVRNATVTVAEPGVLLRLAQQDFHALLHAPLVPRIAHEIARAEVAAGHAQWLDVRLPAESSQHPLAGARCLPLHLLRMKLASLARERRWIVCCDTGRRSAVAAFVLMQRGFDVRVLDGGLR